MDLSIIIVNYNSYALVKDCINSINKYLTSVRHEIIVVDNNSKEKDILLITKDFPLVKFVSNSENKGFGFANNRGVLVSEGELILFLNPDTYLIDSSIIDMIKFYYSGNYGIVAPMLLNADGTIQYGHDNFHTFSFLASEALNLHASYINRSVEKDSSLTDLEPFEIDWALGAAILLRKNIFAEAGGFDERLFLYYEDEDLAKKAVKLGYRNFCFPGCKIVHVLSATSEDKGFSKFHVHRSRLIFMSEYFNVFQNLALRSIFIVSLLLRIIAMPFFAARNQMNFSRIMMNMKMYFKPAGSL